MFKRPTEAQHLTRLAQVQAAIREHRAALDVLEAEQSQIDSAIADLRDPGRIERRAAALAEKIAPLDSQIKALERERGEHKAAGNQAGVEALTAKINVAKVRRQELSLA